MLKSNIEIFEFELTKIDFEEISELDANIRICDFAFFPGIQKHPEFPFEQMKN